MHFRGVCGRLGVQKEDVEMKELVEFVEYVQALGPAVDKRQQSKVTHKAGVIVVLALLAQMCGYTSAVEMAEFSENYYSVLSRHLPMGDFPPAHDTFSRVLRAIDPALFSRLAAKFQSETVDSDKKLVRRLIAIDGKTARGSGVSDAGYKPQRQAHIVSGYDHANDIVLGQVLTDLKSNEITAIPRLLNIMAEEVSGAVITIDAMGTQAKIARRIRELGGDYCLALKGNQSTMSSDVDLYVEGEAASDSYTTLDMEYRERGKVCVERTYKVYDNAEWLDRDKKEPWGIKSVVTATTHIDGRFTERRDFVLSFTPSASEAAEVVRGHWMIESLHWGLDRAFREDATKVKDHSLVANMSSLKKLAAALLKRMTFTRPYRGKRLKTETAQLSVPARQRAFLAQLPTRLEELFY